MRRHAQYGGSRSHVRRCHRPLSCTGHHLLPPWPPQSCLSSAHFLSSKPPTQADTSQSTQSKSRRVPTHSTDTESYEHRRAERWTALNYALHYNLNAQSAVDVTCLFFSVCCFLLEPKRDSSNRPKREHTTHHSCHTRARTCTWGKRW
jgi:hypothetical protein